MAPPVPIPDAAPLPNFPNPSILSGAIFSPIHSCCPCLFLSASPFPPRLSPLVLSCLRPHCLSVTSCLCPSVPIASVPSCLPPSFFLLSPLPSRAPARLPEGVSHPLTRRGVATRRGSLSGGPFANPASTPAGTEMPLLPPCPCGGGTEGLKAIPPVGSEPRCRVMRRAPCSQAARAHRSPAPEPPAAAERRLRDCGAAKGRADPAVLVCACRAQRGSHWRAAPVPDFGEVASFPCLSFPISCLQAVCSPELCCALSAAVHEGSFRSSGPNVAHTV